MSLDPHLQLIAEHIGEVSLRIQTLETQAAAAQAPVSAATEAVEAAARVLEQAREAVGLLRHHVLDSDFGKLSTGLEDLSTRLSALAAETTQRALRDTSERRELSARQRTELEAIRHDLAATRHELARIEVLVPMGRWVDDGKPARKHEIWEYMGSTYISRENGNQDRPSEKSKSWMLMARRGGVVSGGSSAEVATEAADRANADTTLQGNIDTEAATRAAADALRMTIEDASEVYGYLATAPLKARDTAIGSKALTTAEAVAEFTEDWTDLSSWITDPTPGVQVSGNRLYSAGAAGGANSALYPVDLADGEVLLAQIEVTHNNAAASGGVMFGVSSDAVATSDPSNSGTGLYGIYFQAGATYAKSCTNGTLADLSDQTTLATAIYIVSIWADDDYVSVIAASQDGSKEHRVRFARSSVDVNHVALWNADARTTSGSSFGAVAVRKSQAPATFVQTVGLIESWANTSSWALDSGTPGVQVSGNRLYALDPVGGNNGANYSYAITAGQNLKAHFTFQRLAGSATGGLIFGVSDDTPGAAPLASAGNVKGLYIPSLASSYAKRWDQGTGTDLTDDPRLIAGTYTVDIWTDATYIYVQCVGPTMTYLETFERSGFSINNLYLFNSDSRELSGDSYGVIYAVKGADPLANPGVSAPAGRVTLWSGDDIADYRLMWKTGEDFSGIPPLAILFHGNGGDEHLWADNTNGKYIANALIESGYIVLGYNYRSNKATWGSNETIESAMRAYGWAKAYYPFGAVVLWGISMGGLESLLTLASKRLPGVVAWGAAVPATNLSEAYTAANGGTDFSALIDLAYGISGDYSTKTSGHDPNLMEAREFFGIPMHIIGATDDAILPPEQNYQAFVDKVSYLARALTLEETTGGHSADLNAFTDGLVAFFDTYAK